MVPLMMVETGSEGLKSARDSASEGGVMRALTAGREGPAAMAKPRTRENEEAPSSTRNLRSLGLGVRGGRVASEAAESEVGKQCQLANRFSCRHMHFCCLRCLNMSQILGMWSR